MDNEDNLQTVSSKSDNKREDRYIQFPLSFLQLFFTEPDEVYKYILWYGLVNTSTVMIEPDLHEVARQLMYLYYRNRSMIHDPLMAGIINLIKKDQLFIDEDYNGFFEDNFDPEPSISDLLAAFEKDDILKYHAILCYQIKVAAWTTMIEISDMNDVVYYYNVGSDLREKFESKYGSDAMPGMKPGQIIDFMSNREYDEIFRAIVSVRSLIGRKEYVSTYRQAIFMRMTGSKSNAALDDLIKTSASAYEFYNRDIRSEKSKRVHFDRLIGKLLSNGFIKSRLFKRKFNRKIYLSIKLTPDQLSDKMIEEYNKKASKRAHEDANKKLENYDKD